MGEFIIYAQPVRIVMELLISSTALVWYGSVPCITLVEACLNYCFLLYLKRYCYLHHPACFHLCGAKFIMRLTPATLQINYSIVSVLSNACANPMCYLLDLLEVM